MFVIILYSLVLKIIVELWYVVDSVGWLGYIGFGFELGLLLLLYLNFVFIFLFWVSYMYFICVFLLIKGLNV